MIAIEAENLGKCYRMRGLGPQTMFGKIRDLAAGKKPDT
ncbi:MAG: hypothetical protein ACI9TH_004755, partial [Kiritimatiellia bacterium]